MDCSPPGSSVHGILQARILEQVAFPSPGDLPNPGIEPRSPALQADSLPYEPPGKPWQYRATLKKETWARLPGFQHPRLSLTIQAALSTRLNFPLLTSPMRSPDTHEFTAVMVVTPVFFLWAPAPLTPFSFSVTCQANPYRRVSPSVFMTSLPSRHFHHWFPLTIHDSAQMSSRRSPLTTSLPGQDRPGNDTTLIHAFTHSLTK